MYLFSGEMCDDGFCNSLKETMKMIPQKDLRKEHEFFPRLMAAYLFSSFSPSPECRLCYLSIGSIATSNNNNNSWKKNQVEDLKEKEAARSVDNSGDRGMSHKTTMKQRKLLVGETKNNDNRQAKCIVNLDSSLEHC